MIDELDKLILKILSKDSSTSARTIAEELTKSPTTIANRIKKLKDSGIIQDQGVVLNSQALGFEWTVIIEVLVAKGKLVETELEIAKLENCLAVYDVTGQTDIIVIGKFRNRDELSKFTKTLLAMEFVERTISHIALNTIKEDFLFKKQLDLLTTVEKVENDKHLPLEEES
jgi:DNA-binding Lrp family transcriptional regulator